MELNLAILLASFVAYLLGSLSGAVLVCKLFKLDDPRDVGSKNPGSTNVFRIAGKKAAFFTLVLDMSKAFIAVLIAEHLFKVDADMLGWVGLSAVIGHMWPLFFKFTGGKGVASALGVLLYVNGYFALAALGFWLIILLAFRFASLASITTVAFVPALAWSLSNDASLAFTLMATFIILKHQVNIQNLLAGKERRFKST